MRNGRGLCPTLHVTVSVAAWAPPMLRVTASAPLTSPASASAPPLEAASRRESHRWPGGMPKVQKLRGGINSQNEGRF
jgi:hypothetical protein